MRRSGIFKRMRRGESGQSLVIIALGFVALLGFVGLVTDVSLMFVRYSTLMRAVDSASIAAAGQVRRLTPTDEELIAAGCPGAHADPCAGAEASAFARSFANSGVAARQFIEFYGLNPRAVRVDMCASVSTSTTEPPIVRTAIEGLEEEFDQLCDEKGRKLLLVTAQIETPTVFMRLLGFDNFLLEASAVSETALLDVILILDVSESMLNQTTYHTWAEEGYNQVFVPPRLSQGHPNVVRMLNSLGEEPTIHQAIDEYRLWRNLTSHSPLEVDAMLTTNPNLGSPFYVHTGTYPFQTQYSGPNYETRAGCQVVFYPFSRNFNIPDHVRDIYTSLGITDFGVQWEGFVPNYDYYGCCNDPNGDGNFDDLLCQPFREARDATEAFLQRIDFLRGDRVGFVTFDRAAFIVNVERDGQITHMIESEAHARQTLRSYIGVRAESSYYRPSTRQVMGPEGHEIEAQYVPWQAAQIGDPDFHNADTLARAETMDPLHDYRAYGSCPFQDAILGFPYGTRSSPSEALAQQLDQFGYGAEFTYNPLMFPDALHNNKFPRGGAWDTLSGYSSYYSYDLWASCRGTNVGAALAQASNALIDPRTRRDEGVWVMVLLGDGAAGASDPVFASSNPTVPNPLNYPYTEVGYHVQYGGFGVCPPGTPLNSELVDVINEPRGAVFPFCSDEIPESRHFCFAPELMQADGTTRSWVDLDNPSYPDCRVNYDVDDYARDWADWIGLAEPPSYLGLPDSFRRDAQQLPTIFTIGFGLNFEFGTTSCRGGRTSEGGMIAEHDDPNNYSSDVGDCLGEELLRYIADVGDNFRIDTDYQQDWLDNGRINDFSVDDWGQRGPCELPANVNTATDVSQIIRPMPAGQSCGNYYNAPGGDELNSVFDDIASRMFTRLSQ
jgi:hypothetical protein